MADSIMHLPMIYGSRARIGVIVPPTNTANEAEWQALLPADVTLHTARMPLHADTKSAHGIEALHRDIEKFSLDLAAAEVDVIAYGCTAGSMVTPVDSLASLINRKTNRSALTTAQAIVRSLHALKARNISVATPYYDAMNHHEQQFLEENGFRVINIDGMGYGETGIDDFRNICRIPTEQTAALAHRVNTPQADAVLLTCTDLATLSIIPTLEAQLQKPVISSNTATLWYALRLAGINDTLPSAGTLFEQAL
jgi:maleate isomerase/arylmalonate decarboxylase